MVLVWFDPLPPLPRTLFVRNIVNMGRTRCAKSSPPPVWARAECRQEDTRLQYRQICCCHSSRLSKLQIIQEQYLGSRKSCRICDYVPRDESLLAFPLYISVLGLVLLFVDRGIWETSGSQSQVNWLHSVTSTTCTQNLHTFYVLLIIGENIRFTR